MLSSCSLSPSAPANPSRSASAGSSSRKSSSRSSSPEADRLRERFELPLDRVLLPTLLFQVVVPNVVTVAALDFETVDRKCVRIERADLYAPGGESPVGERPGQDCRFGLRPVPAVAAGLLLRAVEVVADPAGVDNARQFGFNGVGGLPVRLSREQGRFPEGVVDRNHVPCQQRRLALREHAFLFPVVFPDGVGVVGWMVPGGRAIAEKTAELMEKYDVAIWAHHGMFCSGEDFDLTFGLMHTVEKSAEILVKILSMTPRKIQTITPENFRELAHDFNVTLPEEFLYEKKK